jgi:hypothetical protein
MDFEQKKLSQDAEGGLHAISIASLEPYRLIFAPAYVHMRMNQKFVSIKGPLDFFTPEELGKLARFETIYFGPTLERLSPFMRAGARVRELLRANPAHELLAPPFVVSDAVIRTVGPLWRAAPPTTVDDENVLIDPLGVAAFVSELCEPLPSEHLARARDVDVRLFDTALLRSSWAVFAAIHLGHMELGFLDRLRDRVFQSSVYGFVQETESPVGKDIETLASFSFDSVFSGPVSGHGDVIRSQALGERGGRVMEKLGSRLKRVQRLASA